MEPIAGLVITYNPPGSIQETLNVLYQHFDLLILVDNGSVMEKRDKIEKQSQLDGPKLKTIFNPRNFGIAKALNQGFSLALQLGYQNLITLDQDSTPAPGMKNVLLEAYQSHPNRENLAVIAPDIIEETLGKPNRYIQSKGYLFFERALCKGEILRNVSFVITSGSMYNLKLYERIGPFRDDFFIDAVDTEYCLRALSKGYEISVACNARLVHHLGNRQTKNFIGTTHSPTFHPPIRWYYINRNRIRMLILYGWRFPYWLFYEITVLITSLFRMLLFENQRRMKLKAIWIGTWHGLTNQLGEIPLDAKEKISEPIFHS